MTLWFVFALMTAAAIFAVLWPLGRGTRPQNDGSETAVYKDQLAEIDRDVRPAIARTSFETCDVAPSGSLLRVSLRKAAP